MPTQSVELRMFSAWEARRWVHGWPTHRLAIVDDDNSQDPVSAGHREDLTTEVIRFSDVTDPDHPMAPRASEVAKVVAFGQGLAPGARLLVHCRGGIGRSSAAALLALVAAGESPSDALDRIEEIRPYAQPNGLVVLLGDEILTPESHELFAAWVQWASKRPNWWHVPTDLVARADRLRRSSRVHLVKAQTHRQRGVDHGPLRPP